MVPSFQNIGNVKGELDYDEFHYFEVLLLHHLQCWFFSLVEAGYSIASLDVLVV